MFVSNGSQKKLKNCENKKKKDLNMVIKLMEKYTFGFN